jgi:hypothetical protein
VDRKNPNNDTISNYEVDIKNANINPEAGELLTCQLINAQIPNSNYVIDKDNDTLSIIFNADLYSVPEKYFTTDTNVQWYNSGVGWVDVVVSVGTAPSGDTTIKYEGTEHTITKAGQKANDSAHQLRVPLKKVFEIKLSHGNYDVSTLQTELDTKITEAIGKKKIETFNRNGSSGYTDLSKLEYDKTRNDLFAEYTALDENDKETSMYRHISSSDDFKDTHTDNTYNYNQITAIVNTIEADPIAVEEKPNNILKRTTGESGGALDDFVLFTSQILTSQNGIYKLIDLSASDGSKYIYSRVMNQPANNDVISNSTIAYKKTNNTDFEEQTGDIVSSRKYWGTRAEDNRTNFKLAR